jgi:putative nucleotidyltransferase with HDIG domain
VASRGEAAPLPSPRTEGAAALRARRLLRWLHVPVTESMRSPHLYLAIMLFEIAFGAIVLAAFAPDFHGNLTTFAVLVALNIVAERMPISIYGDSSITVGYVFVLPIIAIFGAPGAALTGPIETLGRQIGRDHLGGTRLIRSMLRHSTAYVVAAEAFHLIAPDDPHYLGLKLIPAGLFAGVATFAFLALFVTWTSSLLSGQRFKDVWANHRWVALHYLAFAVVGLGLLASFQTLGYWGIVAYLTPAFMLRISMKQYVDKTAENVEKLKQQNAALESANLEIKKVSAELVVTYNSTLEALVNALEARDHETKGHSVRVARYMLNIAEALGVKPGTKEWTDMQHGALLHDVGKIGVPDAILLKPGKLTKDEWERMRLHPEIGYAILREVRFLQGAAEIVLAHHERWDGLGYPKKLKAEEIPLGSRIFSVVDTFDSMTSDRPYRKAMDPSEALNEILRCSGTQFDPLVVEAFLDIYQDWVIERERLQRLEALSRLAA